MIYKAKRNSLRIVAHALILGVLLSPALSFFSARPVGFSSFFYIGVTNIIIVIIYIINILWQIPTFIFKRKYVQYFGILSGFLLAYITIHYFMFDLNPTFSERPHLPPRPGSENWPKRGLLWLPWLPAASRFLMVLGLGTLVEFFTKFEREQQRIEELEKQKIIKELTFLKSQLNPHFLFNSLNNIYSLAIKKSSETPQAVLLLSEMLRYVIYESGKTIVSLSQEVRFIKNYITLEKMKFSPENMPKITYNFSIMNEEFPIEPLLFITLVENAFKHGISMVSPSFVLISFKEDETEIRLSVLNSTGKSSVGTKDPITKGIGLNNLHKRLSLLYPGRYTFDLVQEKSLFKAFLTIKKK